MQAEVADHKMWESCKKVEHCFLYHHVLLVLILVVVLLIIISYHCCLTCCNVLVTI